MGLDHWLFQIRKCDPEDVKRFTPGMPYDQAYDLLREHCHGNGVLIECNEDTEDLAYIADKITLTCSEVDEDKLKRAYNVPDNAQYVGGRYSPGSMTARYRTPPEEEGEEGQSFEIEFEPEDLEKFEYPVSCEYWLCEQIELRQWRKAYEIQDAIYANHNIANCGYHRIADDETLDAIQDLDYDLIIPRCRANEAIYYHEWY